ncbi:MAG TPA: DEAD/DEAH box helicase [Candidatus Sulfomarinibacteraceae bacterium]|nr:DEAD/DEAH box helicase [Candidatus Sulfomarinibacteraceae bacterium]
MSLSNVLTQLRTNRDFVSQVVAWEHLPGRPAQTMPLRHSLLPALSQALRQRGVEQLYTHQATAIDAVLDGADVVVATGTASGKSLCYTIPVLQTLLTEPTAQALYLFPTKALAHDQLAETAALIEAGELSTSIHSYDGDTPRSRRRDVREAGGIVVSNPDMLHAGILPYHTSWRHLLSQLRFVVVDEIHTYRGVFGSHVANVLRRLRRLCNFYGSDPQFICCSATIANPREHAERLVETSFVLVDEMQNGAPAGEKQFILYNPPLIDEELGLRRSSVLMAKDAAASFLFQDVQTVVFARARQTVELLLAYLRDEMQELNRDPEIVAGYRGGYLPLERRAIEQGLRNGEVRGVVATNALELGIDIGQLGAAVLTGYPGSIASTWQQAGRAGRRSDLSAVVLVANSSPLDQYICNHPRFLFGRSPEHALLNADNLRIMVKHLLCAAFELPFKAGESFGGYGPVDELLELLVAEGVVYETRQQYHWLGEGVPASSVSLRTSGGDSVVVQDISGDRPQVIGEVDLESVPLLLYEGAVYMHQARTYLVEELDWANRVAFVRGVDVDYYTRASIGSTIRRLAAEAEAIRGDLLHAFGDVLVVTKATAYRKIKRYSHETLGFGDIDLPEIELDTSGYWLVFGEALTEELIEAGVLLRPNDYGPNWQGQRLKALERDDYRCRTCGAGPDTADEQSNRPQMLHVHHIRPFRDFGYVPGRNENYRQANRLENLITLCPSCHRRAEEGQRTRSALGGLAYVLRNLAPLYLMCDPGDIQVSAEARNPLTGAPTVVIYERVPAGVGFSQRLFELHDDLLNAALELIDDCRCRDGCPACVGPPGEIGPETRDVTRQLLRILTRTQAGVSGA